ncbi:MAG TPA: response regulator [Chitinophagaceae bacterium]|jgi:CheY-like chemotaxis protein
MEATAKKILIIDDDSRNTFALSAVLRSRGFECLCATGIGEALTLLYNHTGIDIILMDMMMPEMDGYEGIPALRAVEHAGDLPIIAVTAQAMKGDREKCLAAGADGYLPKPVNVDDLLEILNEHIN